MALPLNDPTGGWNASAEAWIRFVDEGDTNRTHLLDPVMLEVCGRVSGRRVLDIGCGEGRFCRMLKPRGARTVGIDRTPRLVEEAKKRDPKGDYEVADAEKLPFPEGSFDWCVSYIALVDIKDYRRAIAEMARVLKPGGRVAFANLQCFATTTANGSSKKSKRKKAHLPVYDFPDERAIIGQWRGIEVLQYHRPLEATMQAFLDAGLTLKRFIEPVATAAARRTHPSLKDDQRVPIFVVMEWAKP